MDAGAGPCAKCGRPGHNARWCNAKGHFKIGDGIIYNRRSVLRAGRLRGAAAKREAIQRKWAREAKARKEAGCK